MLLLRNSIQCINDDDVLWRHLVVLLVSECACTLVSIHSLVLCDCLKDMILSRDIVLLCDDVGATADDVEWVERSVLKRIEEIALLTVS